MIFSVFPSLALTVLSLLCFEDWAEKDKSIKMLKVFVEQPGYTVSVNYSYVVK